MANLEPILTPRPTAATRVEIDMEAHGYVGQTLEVAPPPTRATRRSVLALQAYLRRTAGDLARPARRDAGAAREGLLPRAARTSSTPTSARSIAATPGLFATLLARGHPIDAATHDPALIEGVRRRVDDAENGWSRVEFQMLYGVRRDLQASLSREGYPVRVYIPYGTEWYPYLTRRLAERPANLWFFASNLLRSAR